MELVKILKCNQEELMKSREERIKSLEIEEHNLNQKFLKVRKTLKVNLSIDEKQLRFLTAVSNESLEHFRKLLKRGNYIVSLSDTCKKFETFRENISKFLPVLQIELMNEVFELKENEEAIQNNKTSGDGLTDDEKLYKRAIKKGFTLPKLDESTSKFDDYGELLIHQPKSRPKTSVPARFLKSATTGTDRDSAGNLSTPESIKKKAIEEISFHEKKLEETEQQIDSTPSSSLSEKAANGEKGTLEKCYESLEKMEVFWVTYNKVEVDVMEIKEEKKVLVKENRQLRGIIRAVLEAAALAKSIPESRVATRVPSKRRSAYSAPLRRILFS